MPRMHAHEKLYRDAIEHVWNRGDLAAVDRFFAEDYLGHDSMLPRRGRDALRAIVEVFREAIHELHYTIHTVVCDGDWIAARWTVTGRHAGLLFGVQGKGAALEVNGMSMNRIADGRIAEGWIFNDTVSLFRQLGTFPEELLR